MIAPDSSMIFLYFSSLMMASSSAAFRRWMWEFSPGKQEVKYKEGEDGEAECEQVLFGIRVFDFANLCREKFLLQISN
jgi:hypothetical protein